MAIENFKEVQDYMNTNKDSEEVKGYVGGLITSDRVNEFLNGEEGKKLLQPKLDSYHSKGLETWKTNNLQKLIDEAVTKANPKETPEQKQIRELTAKWEKSEKDRTHETLRGNALKIATEKKLPSDLIDYFIGNDETTTVENLNTLEKVFSAQVEAVVKERLKGGYQPHKDDKSGKSFTMDDLKTMTPEDINAHWAEIQSSLGKK